MAIARHALIFALTFTVLAAASYEASLASSSNATFVRPKSYNALKFAYTVRQERDFTCGAAALATILKYHYDMPVTEDMIISMMVARYTDAEWIEKHKEGLSFEDLIYVAQKLGFQATAAVAKPEQLEKLSGPVIIQLVLKKNDHFTVLRKKTSDIAYLSDPIAGAMTLDQDEFLKKFRGPILAVWPSYIKGDFFSGLSVIRDPISVERLLSSMPRIPYISPFVP